jgi:hypothetical protein
LHQPKNSLPKIEAIWAFLSIDPNDGNEGLCACPMPDLGMMPLIAAGEKRVDCLRSLARTLAQQTGMKIKLVPFETRTD